MRTSTVTFVCSVLFALAPHLATAQSPVETDGAWLVSPHLALVLDDDADASLAFGGALAYPLTAALAIEGELGHALDLVRPELGEHRQ